MATWDGSYPEPDGSSYYVNSNRNHAPANIPTWDYYLPNSSNGYAQNAATPYNLETSMVFEQSTPNYYNHTDRNTIPPLMSNIAQSVNGYSNNGMPSIVNKVSIEK